MSTTTIPFLQQAETATIKGAAHTLRAINHPLRQKMLRLIQKKGSINVTDMYHALQLEQSVASQHLAILRKAGVVNTERSGKEILYSIRQNAIDVIMDACKTLTSIP